MDLVFIHGPAAVGKLTVARALAEATGFGVFHNHLTVDALTAVFPFGSEPFVRLREQIWLGVFGEAARHRRSLIFTFTPERTVRPSFVPTAVALVESHGGRVRFVRLTCRPEELERRLTAESRRAFGKLRSPELFRQLAGEGAFEHPDLPGPDLLIDTGHTTPAEAAERICRGLGLTRTP